MLSVPDILFGACTWAGNCALWYQAWKYSPSDHPTFDSLFNQFWYLMAISGGHTSNTTTEHRAQLCCRDTNLCESQFPWQHWCVMVFFILKHCIDLLCRPQSFRWPGIASLHTSIFAEGKPACIASMVPLWDRYIKCENKSGDGKALNYLNIVHVNLDGLGMPKFGSVQFSGVFAWTTNQNRTARRGCIELWTRPAEPDSNSVRTELNLQFFMDILSGKKECREVLTSVCYAGKHVGPVKWGILTPALSN